MKWITSKKLQNEFGLSWAEAEQIIREQVRMLDGRWDWRASMHGGRLALLELPGLAVLAFAWLVLPRLLAGDAILAVAKERRPRGALPHA
jgi:hypothetical protein